MIKICSKHLVKCEWKEGTSKEGKPYAFWACPIKENGQFCKAPMTEVADGYIKETEIKEEKREPVNQEPDNTVWEAKDRMNMYQSALKAASEVVAAYVQGSPTEYTLADAESKIITMANDLYNQLVKHRDNN